MTADVRRTTVEIGAITKPHGLRGEVVVSGVRVSADEFRSVGEVVAVARDGTRRPLTIRSVRPFQARLLVCFDGVDDVDEARTLHGQVLEVERERLPPAEPGQVYLFQLMGATVVTEDGRTLGVVRDLLPTGAAPVLVLSADGGRERLVPMSPDVLVEVDTDAGRIVVRELPGLDQI